MSGHTPGPWRYEAGGGHAHNSIRGSEPVQTNGWPEPRGGYSCASYSDKVCENLGDVSLPGPAANAALIAAAPDMLEELRAVAVALSAPSSEWPHLALARLQFIRAAIAKATQP